MTLWNHRHVSPPPAAYPHLSLATLCIIQMKTYLLGCMCACVGVCVSDGISVCRNVRNHALAKGPCGQACWYKRCSLPLGSLCCFGGPPSRHQAHLPWGSSAVAGQSPGAVCVSVWLDGWLAESPIKVWGKGPAARVDWWRPPVCRADGGAASATVARLLWSLTRCQINHFFYPPFLSLGRRDRKFLGGCLPSSCTTSWLYSAWHVVVCYCIMHKVRVRWTIVVLAPSMCPAKYTSTIIC